MDISALSFPLYFTLSGISPSLSSRAPNEILLKSKYRRHPFLVPPTSTLQTQGKSQSIKARIATAPWTPINAKKTPPQKSAIRSSGKLLRTRRGNSVASPPPPPQRQRGIHFTRSREGRAGTDLPQSDGSKAKPRYYGVFERPSSSTTASPHPKNFPTIHPIDTVRRRLNPDSLTTTQPQQQQKRSTQNQTLRERKGRKKMPSTTSPPPSNTSSPSSPNTLTPETLETDLLTHLASTTALEDLHATLLSSLQRLGWTEKIRKLSLELLRAGRCERFDDVVEAVVASAAGIKPPSAAAQNGNGNSNNNNNNNNHSEDDLAELDEMDVRIPKAVVEQGVRAIKEVLREVIVIEDDPDLNALHQSEHVSESKGSLEAEGEKEKSKISKSGESSVKNGDTSPTKKTEKKPKTGKQVK
ncbi:hypothetical protein IFM61606_08065 [Aspergillus udagawae]|nr:hypothetical protein IFM5058_09776 [Aspergillus udagawae]GFG27993.1 hypothetical protein IFM61606_08065 [Aspergillus udagawae]